MPRTPRLTKTDRADLEARHQVVTARIIAAEDIARHQIKEPIADATRRLMARVAVAGGDVASVKRSVYSNVRSLSDALSGAVSNAVTTARGHARNLANGQAASDLAGFVKRAQELRLPGSDRHVAARLASVLTTRDHDAALGNQAGLSLAHRWSSQVLGNHVQWKREGGGVDGLVRRIESAGEAGMANLVETHAITLSVDAYADQHALVWNDIASQVAGTEIHEGGDGAGWGAGLYDVWSAILDRGTCSVCRGLDGEMVPAGTEWPGAGRPPNHARCRCEPVAMFIPEAAIKKIPGVQLDYAALKADIQDYARGATLQLGEGKRHAQEFFRDALAGTGQAALAAHLSDRRAWFPNRLAAKAPRLLF